MIKKILFLLLSLFFFTTQRTEAQEVLNKYQYILIPNQFSFQSEPNEYNINHILKIAFEKYRFKTFKEGDVIPNDINACDILRLNITKSGFMSTKMILNFSNCYGQNVYNSIEGVSRIKTFKRAFYEALRESLKDENIKNHKYNKTNNIIAPKKEFIAKEKTQKTNSNPKDGIRLTLRDRVYFFVKNKANYDIYSENNTIATAYKNNNSSKYIIKESNLKGEGSFDDFGNFIIIRTNPINKKKITDVMERTN